MSLTLEEAIQQNYEYEGSFCHIPVWVKSQNKITLKSKNPLYAIPLRLCLLVDGCITKLNLGNGFALNTTKIDTVIIKHRNAYASDEAVRFEHCGFEIGKLYYEKDAGCVVTVVGEGVAGMPEVITFDDATYYAYPNNLKRVHCTQCTCDNVSMHEYDNVKLYCNECQEYFESKN